MSDQKPAATPAPAGRAVDDEDPTYSPMEKTPAPDQQSAEDVEREIREDNDRISKGAP